MAAIAPNKLDLVVGDLWTFPFRWTLDGASAIPVGGKMAGLIKHAGGSINLTVDGGQVEQDQSTGDFVITVPMNVTATVKPQKAATLHVLAYDAAGDRTTLASYQLNVRTLP